MRRTAALSLLLLLGAAAPAVAPPVEPAASQARAALEALRDPARRAALEGVLEALARIGPSAPANPGSDKPAPAAPAGVPLQPGSVGADLLVGASDRFGALSDEFVGTVRAITAFPLVARWLLHLATDPDSQEEVFAAAWHVVLVLGAGLLAARLLSLGLARPLRWLARAAPAARAGTLDRAEEDEGSPAASPRRTAAALLLLRRLPLAMGRLALELAPTLLLAAVGFGLLATRLGDRESSRLVVLAALRATLAWRGTVAVARTLVSPDLPRLRLVGLSDVAAGWVARWLGRIAAVASFGTGAIGAALALGLYQVAHDPLVRLLALGVVALLGVMVTQCRRAVARVLRPKPTATGLVAAVRRRVAASWHVVALFTLFALWLVWALETPDGVARLVRGLVATFVVVNVARLLAALLHSSLDRVPQPTPAGPRGVWDRYRPLLRATLSGLLVAVAAVVLLQAWGFDALSWVVAGDLGSRLAATLVSCAVTLAAAAFVWEAANAGIAGHLARLDTEQQLARSARLRTLLPMLRTALLVAIVLFVALSVMSEVGVNVAPLLAGAGVLGIAIGFGSQKLVQDVITGIFLLLENTMQVGDVVTLGGLTGTVENLSIRTIRLRSLDGSIHVVPFSAVTTVTNMTRDFAYAVIDLGVGLDEEPDAVAALVREVAAAMRAEPRWASVLEGELDVMGIERFVDTAYVLRLRIKTRPSQRWAVARELNQRIKRRFDADAIDRPDHVVQGAGHGEADDPGAVGGSRRRGVSDPLAATGVRAAL